MDGGGGALSGGEYTLVGVDSGSSYELSAGFWGGAGAEYHIYLPLTLKKS